MAEKNKNGLIDPIELGIASDAFDTVENMNEESDSEVEVNSKNLNESINIQDSELVRIKSDGIAPPDETISSALFITPNVSEQEENRQDRPLIF